MKLMNGFFFNDNPILINVSIKKRKQKKNAFSYTEITFSYALKFISQFTILYFFIHLC